MTLRTGFIGADGCEETVTEYLCDWPDCPNIAVHVLVVREIAAASAVCDEHAAMIEKRKRSDSEGR